MKKYLFLTAIISLVFLRCGEDSNPIDNENDGSLLVAGKVSNFSGNFDRIYTSCFPFSDSLLKVESEIKTDGSFNLNIPVPSGNYLSNYSPVNRVSVINGDSIIYIDSIHIQDNNLKYIRYDLFAQSSTPITYSLEINLAEITNPSALAEVGNYYISYYYFNSNTKVEGYYKLKIVTADSSREFITEFNVNTKIGWNKLLTKFKSEVPNKSVYEVTDITTDQGNWIIGASGSFSNGVWKF
ncbi:MAG: hypothetical protein GXO79_03195 [Chlorobi bacterium]|nr:hypothetical protein [Chlorobiota bacterium]